MESGSQKLSKSQHFSDFAEVLRTYVTDSFDDVKQPDAFSIIKEYRSIAGKAALSLVDTKSQEESKTAYTNWELEAQFWHILDLLLDFRISDIPLESEEARTYNSNSVFERELLQENRELYEIWLIIIWLQENIKIQDKPEKVPVHKWSHTFINGDLNSADLDYPLRDNNVTIHEEDKFTDHIFFKYIYELLLSGNFEKVYEECKLSDNITLAMVISGMQEYLNPKIDTQFSNEFTSQQGIKKHALWRRTVHELAKTTELDPYERAIYYYISGTLPDEGLVEGSTWESDLLLNLNQILQINVENYLLQKGKIDKAELISTLSSTSPSLVSILNDASTRYPRESSHPIRILIGSIILNTIDTLVHSSVKMLLDIMKGNETSNEILDEPYLLRIVTHLTIILDIIIPGKVDNSDKVKLITAYISILKLNKLYGCIPIYIKFLNDNDALETYSFILSTISESTDRKEQLELMDYLRLPTANILRRTTQRVFVESESMYIPKGNIVVSSKISGIDKYTIHAVEWLINGKLSNDAVKSIIVMGRRFLLNGRIKSLQYFFDNNNIDVVMNSYKLENLANDDIIADDIQIKEILEYQSLVKSYEMYEEWQKAIKQLNSESNIPTLIEKFQEYTDNTLELIKTFFVELTADASTPDYMVLYEIRALYIPYFLIELHKGLVEAARLLKIPTFLKNALDFTSLVANETDSLYLLFQSSGKLKEYLQLIAHTATLLEKE